MAATVLAEQPVLGAYVNVDDTQFTTLTMTAGDATNMNKVVMSTGRCLVLFQNSDAVNAEWVTVFASNDPFGRATDITEQDLAASAWGAFILEARGWEQTLGGRDPLIDVESSDVKILAIPI
jgi:hypothetical protein